MDNLVCMAIIVLPIVGIVVFLYARDREIKEAKKKYYKALQFLRENPGNSDAREAALLFGRAYVARLGKRSTYTEVSLMNDLNAIQPSAQQAPAHQPDTDDVKTRLKKLELLYDEGIITEEEYQTRRQEILSEL